MKTKVTSNSTESSGFVIRITRDSVERKLFLERKFYVGLKRDWVRGSKAIFIKKLATGDSFVGTAVIEKFLQLDMLAASEQKLCVLNNWYGKIIFGIITEFLPPVNTGIKYDSLPPLQTGQQIAESEIERISTAASGLLIS